MGVNTLNDGLHSRVNSMERETMDLGLEDTGAQWLSTEEGQFYEQEIRRLHEKRTQLSSVPLDMDQVDNAVTNEPVEPVGSHLWAIVVGIDHYDDGATLSGCVNDPELVLEFLIDYLRVPPSHIIALTSSPMNEALERKIGPSRRPTRAAILDALYNHFRDNKAVKHKDNIFFSFSGFGSLYGASDGPSRTQALCPMDRDLRLSSGSYVCDISDRELDAILSEIRDNKGANITVVLDCSHSPTSSARTRSLPHMYDSAAQKDMFEAAEGDSRRQRDKPSLSSPSWKADTSSHVLLAACQPHETAKEITLPMRQHTLGVLTRAFIYALKSPGLDPSLTYEKLVKEVKEVMQPSTSQTFVVTGEGMYSRLWFRESQTQRRKDRLMRSTLLRTE